MDILYRFYLSLSCQERLDIIVTRRLAHNHKFAVPRPGDIRYSPRSSSLGLLKYWDEVVAEDGEGVRREAWRLMHQEMISWENPGRAVRVEDEELAIWIDRCIRTGTDLGFRYGVAFQDQADELWRALRARPPVPQPQTNDAEFNTWLARMRPYVLQARRQRDDRLTAEHEGAPGTFADMEAIVYAELPLQYRRYSSSLSSITTEESGYDGDNEGSKACRARSGDASV